MENLDLQSNLEMMENTEFEEKVDIDDLVLPSKPTKMAEIEINDVKEEQLEEQHATFESAQDIGKKFKLKMKENILKLCEKLEKEKAVDSMVDFSLRRSIIISQFVEKIAEFDPLVKMYEKAQESLKEKTNELANIKEEHESVKVTNEELLKTIQELEVNKDSLDDPLVKMNEKTQAALDEKTNELANIKKELQSVSVANQELLQKIQELKKSQELEVNKNSFANNDSSTMKIHCEIKPFSCKYCDQSFLQVHEVKEHIKIHKSMPEVDDETLILSYDKGQ